MLRHTCKGSEPEIISTYYGRVPQHTEAAEGVLVLQTAHSFKGVNAAWNMMEGLFLDSEKRNIRHEFFWIIHRANLDQHDIGQGVWRPS